MLGASGNIYIQSRGLVGVYVAEENSGRNML